MSLTLPLPNNTHLYTHLFLSSFSLFFLSLNTSQVSRVNLAHSETIEVKSIDQPSGKWINDQLKRSLEEKEVEVKSEIKPEATIITTKTQSGLPYNSKSFAYWTRQDHDIGRALPVATSHGPGHGHYHTQVSNGHHFTSGNVIRHVKNGQNSHHLVDDSPVHTLNYPFIHRQFYHQNIHPFNLQEQYHHQYPHDGHVSHGNDVNLGHILNYQLKQPIYNNYHHSHSHPPHHHHQVGHSTHLHHRKSHSTSGYEVHAPNYIVWNYRN